MLRKETDSRHSPAKPCARVRTLRDGFVGFVAGLESGILRRYTVISQSDLQTVEGTDRHSGLTPLLMHISNVDSSPLFLFIPYIKALNYSDQVFQGFLLILLKCLLIINKCSKR